MWIQRHQRKLILLFDRLEQFKDTPPENSELCFTYVSSTPPKYILKRPENEITIDKEKLRRNRGESNPNIRTLNDYDKVVTDFLAPSITDKQPISNKEFGVFSFAKAIGFEMQRARYVLDYVYAEIFPTFSSFTLTPPSISETTQFMEKHGGLYSLYRIDLNETTKKISPHGVILRAAISIRYPIPYKPLRTYSRASGTRKIQPYRIRCKWNAPIYHPQQEPSNKLQLFKYDGYVAPAMGNKHLQWLLESRGYPGATGPNTQNRDVFLSYTSTDGLKVNDFRLFRGVVLTQNQGQGFHPTYSNIVLAKLPNFRIQTQVDPMDSSNTSLASAQNFYSLIDEATGHVFDERTHMRDSPKALFFEEQDKWSDVDSESVKFLYSETPVL